MSRRTETAYKAWSPGKAAQHVEAQDTCLVTGQGRGTRRLSGGQPAGWAKPINQQMPW